MKKNIFSGETGFARFMNILADILIIGILWAICSLPVITAGTATTSAYYAMAKSVRYGEGYAVREFFHSFKINFKSSIGTNFLFLIGMAIVVADIIFTWGNRSTLNDSLFLIMCLVGFIISVVAIFYCILLSRFSWKTGLLFKNSFILSFKYLYVSVLLLVLFVGCLISIYLLPWSIAYLPGLYMFIATYPMEWIMRKVMPKPEEGSLEADKWYYGSGRISLRTEEEIIEAKAKKEKKLKEKLEKKSRR